MFTGIVQGIATLVAMTQKSGYLTIKVKFPQEHLIALELGASVALNGVCLTVVSIEKDIIDFDVIQNSLKITTFDSIKIGDSINFERSLKNDSEIGGHFLSGHVDFSAKVTKICTNQFGHGISILIDTNWMKYIFDKGFIGINGASLTVAEVDKTAQELTCWIIPETLTRTNMSQLQVGSLVNIEIDRNTQIIVDTLSRVAHEHFGKLSHSIENIMRDMGTAEVLKNQLNKLGK